MLESSTELLTLPPQLLEAIRDLLNADVALPEDLRRDLASASEAAEGIPPRTQQHDDEAADAEIDDPRGKTIPLELIEGLSRWSNAPGGAILLKRGGLDPPRYSLVSLLAGTELWMPKAKRERLLASTNPDKPNPYLPSYLSASPPSLGQEIRSMTTQLTTVLNVLFSVGGSAAAVYVAAVTGAGYRRESAILLGLLAAIVVGIADGVLIWIYSTRLESGRKGSRELALAVNRAPGRTVEGSESKSSEEPAAEMGSEQTRSTTSAVEDGVKLRKRTAHRDRAT